MNPEGNARLTGSVAALLFILLGMEGVTLLRIRNLLTLHVFIGMLLIPPVLIKICSTTYRFIHYYRGDPTYRTKGPPPVILRLLGPLLIATTVLMFASGVALLVLGSAWTQSMLFIHKASFVLWFGMMAIHVLGHLLDTARLAPRDWYHGTRRDVAGASARQWTLVIGVLGGILLGASFIGRVGPWLALFQHSGH